MRIDAGPDEKNLLNGLRLSSRWPSFIRYPRTLYDAIAAPDKTLEFIKADHYLQEPTEARTQSADLIAAWGTSRS